MKVILPIQIFIAFIFANFLLSCTTSPPKSEASLAPSPTPSVFHFDLPGAPVPESAEDVSDYQTLLHYQKIRTHADCRRGKSEVKITLAHFFGPPYGPLKSQEVEPLKEKFEKISAAAWSMIGDAKNHWSRPRPFVTHSDLTPCARREPSFSYPSGHAALSQLYVDFLIPLFPDRAELLQKRADQIDLDRNLVGVHYPSDVRDGKVLGDQIYQFLKNSGQYPELFAR